MKIILSCLFLLAIATAQAGDIRGTIINKSRLNPKHIVVYLDGNIAVQGTPCTPENFT